MSLNFGAAGDRLILRIHKYLGTRPDTKWVNNYELVASDQYNTTTLADCADNISSIEASFHSNAVVFDRWTFSSWEEDSKPYDPNAFTGGSFGGLKVGIMPESSSGDISPLDIVLWVARVVPTGRQGKLFYRGVMGENWITAPAGVPTFSNTNLLTSLGPKLQMFGPYCVENETQDPPSPFKLALIGKSGLIRLINRIEARGVAVNKRDRGYFDRL